MGLPTSPVRWFAMWSARKIPTMASADIPWARRGVKLLDRGAATLVIDGTFVGQRQSPRRAIEEPDAERGLEALHVPPCAS